MLPRRRQSLAGGHRRLPGCGSEEEDGEDCGITGCADTPRYGRSQPGTATNTAGSRSWLSQAGRVNSHSGGACISRWDADDLPKRTVKDDETGESARASRGDRTGLADESSHRVGPERRHDEFVRCRSARKARRLCKASGWGRRGVSRVCGLGERDAPELLSYISLNQPRGDLSAGCGSREKRPTGVWRGRI